MSAADKNIARFKKWHLLKRKLLTGAELDNQDRSMLLHALAQCECVEYPSIREIEDYSRKMVQLEHSRPAAKPEEFNRLAEQVAAFEETYLPPIKKIERSFT